MRELIKKGAYSVTAPRTITVTDGRQFNEEDIRLIYNETKDEVLVSSGEKVGVTVVDEVITIPNDKAAIDTNDILTIEIDFPQKLQQLPEFTVDVTFQSTSTSFTITQSGILTSFGDCTNVKIKPKDTFAWIDISLPYFVNKGDKLFANAVEGTTQKCVIQYASLSGSPINTGQLGADIINGCNNFAYYSDQLGMTLISGLATFDESGKMLVGDGYFAYVGYPRSLPIDSNYVELDGYLYMFSDERLSIIKVNLSTHETTLIASSINNAENFYQVKVIGDYIYYFGWTINGYASLTSSAYGSLYSDGNPITSVIDDGAAVYSYAYNATVLNKIVGTAVTNLSGVIASDLVHYNGHVYAAYSNTVQKIRTSDMTLISTITSNYSGTVSKCIVSNGNLITIYSDGTVTKIDLTEFVSVATTINIGAAVSFPSVKYFNGKIYLINRGASSFYIINTAAMTSASNPLNNDHNSISIDEVNLRLIFYSHQIGNGITLKPVEIINIP